jgi:ribonucleotide monophosphatase NagD (HAD superfamily)
MVGDRIDTDVPFGKSCGMNTLLVESGMSKMKDVQEVLDKLSEKSDENLSKMVPDFILPHLGDIHKKLANKL